MKTYLDCIPCFVQQALRAGKMATNDELKIKEILNRTGELIRKIPMNSTPAETGTLVYEIVKEVSGVDDPYAKIKAQHIAEAKSIYPELEAMVNQSEDRLLTAIKIAIAGNMIDLGVNKDFNVISDVRKMLQQDFAISDYDSFKKQWTKSNDILYIGDNSGESVFDKILIQELKKPVKYVVRSKPIINDVTMKDAMDSGLHEVADLIESGTQSPGIILNQVSQEFLIIFNHSDLVISKGQGNYEGLSGCNRQIFFLLKAKCHPISRDIGVPEGGIVFKEYRP